MKIVERIFFVIIFTENLRKAPSFRAGMDSKGLSS
jgi:hypothetical protein